MAETTLRDEIAQLRIQVKADNAALSRLVARQRAELRRASRPSEGRKERLRLLELAAWHAEQEQRP